MKKRGKKSKINTSIKLTFFTVFLTALFILLLIIFSIKSAHAISVPQAFDLSFNITEGKYLRNSVRVNLYNYVSNPDGLNLTYSCDSLPQYARIDSRVDLDLSQKPAYRGVFYWQPGYEQGRAEPYIINFFVSDGTTILSLGKITVTVNDVPLLAPKTYYISFSEGNDSNDGMSPEKPWKNLYKICSNSFSNNIFYPGDKVLLKRGDIWHGQIRVGPIMGTKEAPITIGAYGSGEKPRVYGHNTNEDLDEWQPVARHPGIYSTYVGEGSIMSYALEDGKSLKLMYPLGRVLSRPADLEDFLINLTNGSFGPQGHTNTIYMITTNNQSPETHDIKLYRGTTVSLGGKYTILENLDIRDSNEGITVDSSDNMIIRNCNIQNTLWVAILLRWDNENCLVENNIVNRTKPTALYLLTGKNNTFRGNSVSSVGGSTEQCGIGLQWAKDTVVEYNNFSFLNSSGVDYWLDEGSIVRYNYFYRIGSGGVYPHGTNMSVYGNIFYIDWKKGDSWQTSSQRAGMNTVNVGNGTVRIFNNVFYSLRSYGLMGSSDQGKVIFRNNIVYGGTGASCSLASLRGNVDSDYNCFYEFNASRFAWNGTGYKNLTLYQNVSGQDNHSIFANPEFVSDNPRPFVAEDFKLKDSSPCRNKGANLRAEGIASQDEEWKDYAGNSFAQDSMPDIGAYEYTEQTASAQTPGEGGSSNDGGGTYKPCAENWSCSWTQCIDNIQGYVCKDLAKCNTTSRKPADAGKTKECVSEAEKDKTGIQSVIGTLKEPPKSTPGKILYYSILAILFIADILVLIMLVKKIILLRRIRSF